MSADVLPVAMYTTLRSRPVAAAGRRTCQSRARRARVMDIDDSIVRCVLPVNHEGRHVASAAAGAPERASRWYGYYWR